MNEILSSLQYSVDNDHRQRCQLALREIQEKSPHEFLTYITPLVLMQQNISEVDAFFAASVLLDFVRECWRNVPSDAQIALHNALLHFLTTRPLASPKKPLGTKLCSLLGLVTKLQLPRKTQKGPSGSPLIPESLEHTLQTLIQAAQANDAVRMQSLMALHYLLKELLSKRIGKIFDLACAYVSPTLCQWILSTGSDPQHRELFVMCLKIALRVYGHGVFQIDAYQHIISVVFQLAREVATMASATVANNPVLHLPLTVRALEYGCKILLVATESFGPKLADLGVVFFADDSSQSLFRFVLLALQACWNANHHGGDSGNETFTDKLACRCMRIVTEFSNRSDGGDEFATQVLGTFAQSQTCVALVRLVVEQYLADDAAALQVRWTEDPEGLVADLDVVDDDDSPGSCAEQLFLALTSNAASSSTCVPCAWTIVNELLQQGTGGAVTAGLHAIGLGYSTLALDPQQYISFLHQRLLPLIIQRQQSTVQSSSLDEAMILRRAVWVVGMWCESVTEGTDRCAVHAALGGLLSTHHSTDAVMLLTTLRAVEHFLTDYNFSVDDLNVMGIGVDPTCHAQLPVYVSHLLAALRHVIPRLRTASMIKEIVALCLSLSEKGALPRSGEAMAFVLQPAVDHFTSMAMKLETSTSGTNNGNDLGVDDTVGPAEMSAFSMILETLTSVMKWTNSNESIWRLLSLVYLCTDPNHAVTPWTQDGAWELLLKMIHYTQSGGDGALDEVTRRHALEALAWTVRHLERDFDCLPLVVRCISALLALLGPLEDSQAQYLVEKVVASLVVTEGPVFQAYSGLACILIAAAPLHTVPRILSPLLHYHHSIIDSQVQEDERLPMLAAVLAHAITQQSVDFTAFLGPEERLMCSNVAPGSSQTLAEKWSLLLDVTANIYAAQCIASAGCELARRGLIGSPEDLAMIQAAHDSVTDLVQQTLGGNQPPVAESNNGVNGFAGTFSPTRGCPSSATVISSSSVKSGFVSGEDAASIDSVRGNADLDCSDIPETREPVDVLLEFLGDGDAGCSNDVPHALRIASLFRVSTPSARVASF